MSVRPDRPAPPSPFDPFIGPFLAELRRLPDGYTPVAGRNSVAAALDWPPAFAEAVFTSARARGLVEPAWGRGRRAQNRWQLSRKGRAWLAAAADQHRPTDPENRSA